MSEPYRLGSIIAFKLTFASSFTTSSFALIGFLFRRCHATVPCGTKSGRHHSPVTPTDGRASGCFVSGCNCKAESLFLLASLQYCLAVPLGTNNRIYPSLHLSLAATDAT